jgi:hypothetical protein
VFSELDPIRSDALVRHLPAGQSLLATAGAIPMAAEVQARVSVCRPALLSEAVPRHQRAWSDGRMLEGTDSGSAVDNAGEIVDDQL